MITVYNTMSRKKELFIPVREGEVSIYCCGVTPYNEPHIGNARPFVVWDVIRRYLTYRGYNVRYIQNFTDIDDKIIAVANKEGVQWNDIAERYIAAYFEAMNALNVRNADVFPRVSDSMEDIICLIERLIARGYAYKADNGDVYYGVDKFSNYGKLSGRSLDDMQAGARIDVNESKKNPLDFALWKAIKPHEPSWDSPWGRGRPGWHIECSAMSLHHLGDNFDFHGGGSDLIFPHHENEIAQAEPCIDGENKFARYWLHNGFITINNEKMSKSQNNFFTVKDILREFPGEIIRFFIIQTHYRSPLDFSYERLNDAKIVIEKLNNTKYLINELMNSKTNLETDSAYDLYNAAKQHLTAFEEAMDDDFNTALAISYLFALAKDINRYHSSVEAGIAFDRTNFLKAVDIFNTMTGIIGIFEQELDKDSDNLSEALIKLIIDIRQGARSDKNWSLADKIRDDMNNLGIVLEDTANGVRYKRV